MISLTALDKLKSCTFEPSSFSIEYLCQESSIFNSSLAEMLLAVKMLHTVCH
jgi:hypothetical protein